MYRFTMVSAAAIALAGCPSLAQAPEDEGRPGDSLRCYAGRGRVFTLGWDYRF